MTFGLPPISTIGVKIAMIRDRPSKRQKREKAIKDIHSGEAKLFAHLTSENTGPKKDKPHG